MRIISILLSRPIFATRKRRRIVALRFKQFRICALVVWVSAGLFNGGPSVSLSYDPSQRESLRPEILKAFSEYCHTLAAANIGLVCEEVVEEETFSSQPGEGRIIPSSGRSLLPKNVINKYRYEFHLRLREGQVNVERFVVDETSGKRQVDKSQVKPDFLNETYALLEPSRFISDEAQKIYAYTLLGEESLQGDKCIVVSIVPKPADGKENFQAKIWAMKKGLLPAKMEWSGAFLVHSGMNLSTRAGEEAEPLSSVTLELFDEKNGIRLPTRYLARESYVIPGHTFLRSRTEIRYSKYAVTREAPDLLFN